MDKMSNVWRFRPLYLEILRILESRGGLVKDKELYDALRRTYDISFPQFLKTLLTLEIQGLVLVRQLKENVRIIELTPLGRRMQI